MLLPEVDSEVVPPCEALVTHVALVPGLGVTLRDTESDVRDKKLRRLTGAPRATQALLPPHLVDLPVVQFDGAEGPCREAAGLELAAIRRLLAVRVQVLPQVNEVLAAVREQSCSTHTHTHPHRGLWEVGEGASTGPHL